MDYTFTEHARQRKNEYQISEKLIQEALDKPTQISYDTHEHVMVKKLYKRKGSPHVLIIIGVGESSVFRIITLITSSKIKKYLK